MEILQLRTNLYHQMEADIPFSVYTVGTENQQAMTRLKGFSAKQLFISFSGLGAFRSLQHNEWDILTPHTLLYIPSEYPHEYLPQGEEPWFVGFVSFVDNQDSLLESWGFGDTPFQLQLHNPHKLYRILKKVWNHSGPHYDVWHSTENFFSFCLELKKQAASNSIRKPNPEKAIRLVRYRDSVVDSATRFLHDHLQRDLTMAELSARVGYSSKQLNRLFQQSLGLTPLQYLHKIRLQTASRLLEEQPTMTIRQIAAHVGMEPVYFTRLFKRQYEMIPTAYRAQKINQ